MLADDEAFDRWLLANVRTLHHSSDTCKMGPSSDPMAVVSPQCEMYAVDGRGRVGDAGRYSGEHQRDDDHDRGEGGGGV